jgi:hypothetical protein
MDFHPFYALDACSGQAFHPVRFLSLSAYICVHPRFVCLFLFESLRVHSRFTCSDFTL